jgi:polyene glycosyltransferase
MAATIALLPLSGNSPRELDGAALGISWRANWDRGEVRSSEQVRRPVLFASLPEPGLLNPLLVIAAELSRRGIHDVWFATDEHRRSDVAALTLDTPVEFASLGPVIPELSAVTWDDHVYREMTQPSRFKAHRAILRQTYRPGLWTVKFRALEAVVDKVQPAMLVVDSTSTFAIDLARARKIPYVLSVPFVPSNVLTSHVPFGRSYAPRSFPVANSGLPYRMTRRQRMANTMFRFRTLAIFLSPGMSRVLREDSKIRRKLGLGGPNPLGRVDDAAAVLCYSITELEYPLPLPPKFRLVGAAVPPLPQGPGDRGLASWLDAHPCVVYIGLGTITRLTRAEIEAMVEVARRLAGRHAILWKLPREQQNLLPPPGRLPDNLRVESWMPSQLDVLAHPNVKVFFTHGGGNGFHEGLYFGKPLVIKPLWVDNFDQAVRGEEFGVSLTLDRPQTIDPDDVADKLTRVLDTPAFTAKAEHCSALLRAAGGRAAAADLVLEVLGSAPGPAAVSSRTVSSRGDESR